MEHNTPKAFSLESFVSGAAHGPRGAIDQLGAYVSKGGLSLQDYQTFAYQICDAWVLIAMDEDPVCQFLEGKPGTEEFLAARKRELTEQVYDRLLDGKFSPELSLLRMGRKAS